MDRRTVVRALLVSLLPAVVTAISACDDDDPTGPSPGETVEESFTFEDGMEGWHAVATDTLSPPIDWHVEHTNERAFDGEGAVELQMENLNDAGKIWMERAFDLHPATVYDVEVEYAFGTSDWGDINLFTIITGVHDTPPRTADELTFQDDTGHGGDEDEGLVWQERSYEFTAEASPDGTLHVTIGVWGTWETERTYFVDDVTVRFTPVESITPVDG